MTTLTFLFLAQQEASGGGNILGLLVPMILMFVMFHFLLIRPQKKKQQELQRQIEALQIGDGIVTMGGIHGIIANKSEHTVTVKVADNVKLKLDRAAIARITSKERTPSTQPDEETQTKNS